MPNKVVLLKEHAGQANVANALSETSPLLLCFSHLRWDFVFQRPQQLLTRIADTHRVIYFEEPIFENEAQPRLRLTSPALRIEVATPVLPAGLAGEAATAEIRILLDGLLDARNRNTLITWYYTPMALAFSSHLQEDICVYDCMDELTGFKNPPPGLTDFENDLFARADLVFTGGRSLYEAKRDRHPRVYAFPSSIDAAHFGKARQAPPDPEDQAKIPHPRVGFFGVIDERMDLDLVGRVAELRPDIHFVMLGPVVKIDPASLPDCANIHWLGGKSYAELPAYLAHWQAGWMPFAMNEATRFISPTKTPEFLAAAVPVVSTPVADVVRPYGALGLVEIARDSASVANKLDLLISRPRAAWLQHVDAHLADQSWDRTLAAMRGHLDHISALESASSLAQGLPMYDWLIVGAGFAGSVLAERIATQRNESVLIIDRRPHVGGNAYDCYNDAGLLIHQYGPHIFHTNADSIVQYLSRFTRWRPYEHRVLARVDGMLLPVPINLDTVNKLYGLDLTSEQMEEFLAERQETVAEIRTAEDMVVSRVGRDLYEKFFRGYTTKQWGISPADLDKSVTARIPTRTNRDDRYFTDSFQQMPAEGYTRMFERMLDHPNIEIGLSTDYRDVSGSVSYRGLIFTGPIDEFFDWRLGRLPYRSLRFQHVTLDQEHFQPVGVVNYPQTEDYTRVTEYKHLTGQHHPKTSLTYEFPTDLGDPYYPVPRAENEELYKRYKALAAARPDVWFVGRLATYRYYNMDQVVGQALTTFNRIQAEMPLVDGQTNFDGRRETG